MPQPSAPQSDAAAPDRADDPPSGLLMRRGADDLLHSSHGHRLPPAQAHTRAETTIPAGYTYLGQLLMHDLAPPVAASAPAEHAPLALESLLGPLSAAQRGPVLWQFNRRPDAFPFFSTDLPRPFCVPGLGIATIPDLRNDTTPMLAQLSALFIAATQHCERTLARNLPAMQARRDARAAAVRMWHRILLSDLLPRLCLSGLVGQSATRRLDPMLLPQLGLAALRIIQGMTRGQYRLGQDSGTMVELMHGETDIERRRHARGYRDFWRIDWRNFFDLDPEQPPQRAMSIAGASAIPQHQDLAQDRPSPSSDSADQADFRTPDDDQPDLAQLVPLLEPSLRAQNPDWSLWSLPRRQALMQPLPPTHGLAPDAPAADDLPLQRYILAEAGAASSAAPVDGHGGGHRLGALGSILLIAAVHNAIATTESALSQTGPTPLESIDSLPALIRHLTPQA